MVGSPAIAQVRYERPCLPVCSPPHPLHEPLSEASSSQGRLEEILGFCREQGSRQLPQPPVITHCLA